MHTQLFNKHAISLKRSLPFVCLVLAFLFMTAAAHAADEQLHGPFNVGYQVIDIPYQKDGQQEALTVAVWYPTAAEPKPHTYSGPTKGCVAIDGAPLTGKGPYPLLVYSHGYGGSGLSAVFLVETLASRGWVVAAPDHHDKYSAARIRTGPQKDFDRMGFLKHVREISASENEDRNRYIYRLDEMKLALDRMLAPGALCGIIDRDRVAIGGHSFGGFTALGLCGPIPDRRDPRIKALLLFSTGAAGYLYSEEELRSVRMPSLLFLGKKERDQKRGSRTMAELADRVYQAMAPPKYFLEVKGANHFSFNNRLTSTLFSGFFGGDEEHFAVIRSRSIAFLERYVAGRETGALLEQPDPLLTRMLCDLPQYDKILPK